MTVGDLKEYLENVPDDFHVCFESCCGGLEVNTVKLSCAYKKRDPPVVVLTYVHRYE